ncbi:hypothetical protein [Kibdelosporangium phytohabitans]|uniref:hypothetical protein n=1 Tax=Kibdelosporangium phytohabitans TaxID=860235 RepID=UPI0012F849B1|nr:hypothetical protein [Kibdelosporangium phytohabitans]MBE1471853.1 hypothetical protein [Kibdelosporangium phytohabitans]
MSYLPPGAPVWLLAVVAAILAVGSLVRAVARLIPQNPRDRLRAWERWLEHRRQVRLDRRDTRHQLP